MNARDELVDVKVRAEKYIAAHDEMIRIGEGVGGLGVKRPDLMPDFDAWWHASEVEHADTVLALIEALAPRTITTPEELEALPHGSVVMDVNGDVARKLAYGWHVLVAESAFDAWLSGPAEGVDLPATVLHEGETA